MKKENMKQVKKTLVNIIIVIVVATIFSISVYADDSTTSTVTTQPFLSTCVANYFDQLKTNFGNNAEGTCGYVAAAMLISYYDSYCDDNFIDDNYDSVGVYDSCSYENINSSGIKRENATGYTDYDEYIDNNAHEFFHLKLLQIGRDDLNLCDELTINLTGSDDGAKLKKDRWEINIYDVKDVIEEYFSQHSSYNENAQKINNNVTVKVSASYDINHFFHSNSNEMIRTEMIDKVKNGIPVIYFGYSEAEDVGHFMIAYDYNESNDEIYFHTGWGDDIDMTDKESGAFIYTSYTAILWLEIDETNLPHSCTNNYILSGTSNTLCACQIYESHPNHSSNHYYVQKIDHRKHWQECCCGDIIEEESHNYSYTYYNAIQHKATCDDCKYEIIPTHTYVEKANASKRWKECACGDYIFLHFHDFEHINYSESEHLLSCTYCDYETLASHEYTDYINENKQWQECVCGNTIINHYHSFEYIYNSENDHVASCTICSYAMNITHDYAPKSISLTQHQQTCVCGDTIGEAEDHYEAEYHSVSNFMHGVHCECGQLIHTETHSMTTVGLNNVCTECGFVMSGLSGGITIKGEEDEFDTCTE